MGIRKPMRGAALVTVSSPGSMGSAGVSGSERGMESHAEQTLQHIVRETGQHRVLTCTPQT